MLALRPQRAFAHVGLAMAYLNGGRKEDAADVLWRALGMVEDPAERAEIEAFRGLALQLAGRSSESVRALQAAGAHPLAKAMLGEVSPASAET